MVRNQPSETARRLHDEFGTHASAEYSVYSSGEEETSVTVFVDEESDQMADVIEYLTDSGYQITNVDSTLETNNTMIQSVMVEE